MAIAWLGMTACAAGTRAPGSPDTATDPFAVIALADSLSENDLWPGFDPRAIPVAIYQNGQTRLFRHPSPPDGFQPIPGHPGVAVFPGRYPAVTANSHAKIDGIEAATLMPPGAGLSARTRAGVLIHEAFHVYQRVHHPGWTANEADLFTYPVADLDGAALRDLEVRALGRALSSPGGPSVCWSGVALRQRGERFALLPPEAVAYERGTELNEGLASYVQHRATGEPDSTILPPNGYPIEAVRQRAYGVGTALARLLDRVSPDWRRTLEANDSTPLDSLLALRVVDAGAGCGFTEQELRHTRTGTEEGITALKASRSEHRAALLGAAGWTLIIDAGAAPLFPQGFDPINVEVVAPGEVLHRRYLKLGGPSGTLEVIGWPSLTEAAGPHPLFNGVRRWTITSLPADPVMEPTPDAVTIRAEGLTGTFRVSRVERNRQTVTLVLPPS